MPLTVGVPFSKPPAASVNPVGNVPALMLNVAVPAPPVCVKVCVYGTPARPLGKVGLVGLTVIVGQGGVTVSV